MDNLNTLIDQLELTIRSIPGPEETERDIAALFANIRVLTAPASEAPTQADPGATTTTSDPAPAAATKQKKA